MKTQTAQVLEALHNGSGITSLEAQERFGIMRLAARIKDLKDDGYCITSQMVSVTNRYGDSVKVAKYWLAVKEAA
jgi:hypothetical protein